MTRFRFRASASDPGPWDSTGARPAGAALLVVSFLVALTVRTVYLLVFRQSPYFDHLLVDAQWHDEWAWDWARGAWSAPGQAFFRAPLYPFYLSGLFRLFGHDLTAVRVVEALVGAGTAAALAGAGARAFGRGAGWMAGLIAAFYGPLVYFGGELLIPNLLTALLAWSLFCLLGPRRTRPLLIGLALLGLAALARPNVLALTPLALAWTGWRLRTIPLPPGRRVVVAVAGALLALGPAAAVTAWNAAQEPGLVVIASQGGVNFAAGNHPRATGRSMEIPELDNLATWREFVDRSRAVAETAAGRPLTSSEVSDYWMERGRTWARQNPGAAASLTLRKAYYLVNAYEASNNRDLYFRRPWPLRPLLWNSSLLAFPWGVIFPLAVAGFAAAVADRRVRGAALFLAVWFSLYGLSLLPFFINARFRMGMVPAMILLAAFALSQGRRLLRPVPVVAGVAAFVLSNSNVAGARLDNPAQEYTKLGATLLEAGRMEEGVAELEKARALAPNRVAPRYLLAEAYLERGDFEAAAREFEEVVALRPADGKARFSLGTSYLALDRYESARAELEVAARLQPEDAATWVNLGAANESAGDTARAVAAYRHGISLNPRAELGVERLAALYVARGDWEAAVEVLDRGVAANRTSFDLRLQLAAAQARTGRFAAALEEVDAALALRPDHPEALHLQRWLGERVREQKR